MAELERIAVELGIGVLRLDTNSARREAVALYQKTDWSEIPRFNDDPHLDPFFEKRLSAIRPATGQSAGMSWTLSATFGVTPGWRLRFRRCCDWGWCWVVYHGGLKDVTMIRMTPAQRTQETTPC